jgi:hypothetical protein
MHNSLLENNVYDKAAQHFLTGGFPESLPIEQAHVHIGMYMGWIIDKELYSEFFEEESDTQIYRFKRREISPALLSGTWNGYLASELFTEAGNMFTYYYYGGGLYKKDYQKILASTLPSIYHVKDSWENFKLISAKISERYQVWKNELDS